MFVLTMGKNALRRAGAAIACMACIAGVLAAADRLGGGTVTTGASAQARIGSVQEMAEYFTGLGMEVDVTTAAADRVKIPRKWDDSFRAFNGVIAESGLSLEKYKGRKVEKWTLLCPALSGAEGQTYGVLLLSYGLSVVFDMDERFACLRPVTLLRYFRAGELLGYMGDSGYGKQENTVGN